MACVKLKNMHPMDKETSMKLESDNEKLKTFVPNCERTLQTSNLRAVGRTRLYLLATPYSSTVLSNCYKC